MPSLPCVVAVWVNCSPANPAASAGEQTTPLQPSQIVTQHHDTRSFKNLYTRNGHPGLEGCTHRNLVSMNSFLLPGTTIEEAWTNDPGVTLTKSIRKWIFLKLVACPTIRNHLHLRSCRSALAARTPGGMVGIFSRQSTNVGKFMEIQSILLNVTINTKLAMKLKSNGEKQRSMTAFPIHTSRDSSVSP